VVVYLLLDACLFPSSRMPTFKVLTRLLAGRPAERRRPGVVAPRRALPEYVPLEAE